MIESIMLYCNYMPSQYKEVSQLSNNTQFRFTLKYFSYKWVLSFAKDSKTKKMFIYKNILYFCDQDTLYQIIFDEDKDEAKSYKLKDSYNIINYFIDMTEDYLILSTSNNLDNQKDYGSQILLFDHNLSLKYTIKEDHIILSPILYLTDNYKKNLLYFIDLRNYLIEYQLYKNQKRIFEIENLSNILYLKTARPVFYKDQKNNNYVIYCDSIGNLRFVNLKDFTAYTINLPYNNDSHINGQGIIIDQYFYIFSDNCLIKIDLETKELIKKSFDWYNILALSSYAEDNKKYIIIQKNQQIVIVDTEFKIIGLFEINQKIHEPIVVDQYIFVFDHHNNIYILNTKSHEFIKRSIRGVIFSTKPLISKYNNKFYLCFFNEKNVNIYTIDVIVKSNCNVH